MSGQDLAWRAKHYRRSFELLSETSELRFQVNDLFFQFGYFIFENRDAIGVCRAVRCACRSWDRNL